MPVETLRPADSGLVGAPFSLRPADSGLVGAPFSLRPADSGLVGAPFSLRPADSGLVGAPFSLRPADSVLKRAPFRPLCFRQQSRLSAVERLEADKAKYVKSQRVALTRQAPIIRKALLPPALVCPAPGRLPSPTTDNAYHKENHEVNHHRRHSRLRDGSAALDLRLLNDLINDVCAGACSPSGSQSGSSSSPSSATQSGSSGAENLAKNDRREAQQRLRDSQNHTPSCTRPRPTHMTAVGVAQTAVGVAQTAVRRVDVRPSADVRTPPQRRPLRPAHPPRATPPSPPPYPLPPPLMLASPALTRLSNASSRGSAHRRAALSRSKSDLSDRFSRADADLERFFNLCGLDPEDAAGAFGRANSDIAPGLNSASASSEGEEGEEQEAEEGEERPRPSERTPYGISVIERNARVIKWLYGIRQAREGAREGAA